jgi:HAE1 family hydrophobic/amphiphilic exporter-1
MLSNLYKNPLRVYLIIGALALLGVISGSKLPISLYPNSNRPTINASISYGSMNAKEFLETYGRNIENRLNSLTEGDTALDKVTAEYRSSRVQYRMQFAWGVTPKEAKKEVETILTGLSGAWPREVRDSLSVGFWSKSSGFIAISFYSEQRDLEELFNIMDPAITPKLSSVKDAENPSLWNPGSKEVLITLNKEVMATLGLFPRQIEEAINQGLSGSFAGNINIGTNRINLQMPRLLDSLEALNNLSFNSPKGDTIYLREVAEIKIQEKRDSNQIFKTSGSKSLILFAKPKTGGNVKRMAEEILKITMETLKELPKDIKYRVLVDPSEFIRASVENVIHEVMLAAGLAVFILFLFIGSFKNTITAAIEIPLSMVLAFILMKLTGMNLNLISLGGLAIAAGMNVDASVVTMENIFRHFERIKGPLTYAQKCGVIIKAVKEVALPIVASTLSTLVVFTPLAFTSNLTNAILGDLAKAVVFSHGFSMFIALILVPTIRLQLMGNRTTEVEIPKAPIEGSLTKIENLFAKSLRAFIDNKKISFGVIGTLLISFALLLIFALPSLKKEIIGTPDTDWMILSVNTSGNTLVQQMDDQAAKIESQFLNEFEEDILYTFTQINQPNNATIMARLKNKEDMARVWKRMEATYKNEPGLYYWVGPWNPAELPLPDPPHFLVEVKNKDAVQRKLIAKLLLDELEEKEVFPSLWSTPSVQREEIIKMTPKMEQWSLLKQKNIYFTPWDVTDVLRTATNGRNLNNVTFNSKTYSLKMKYANQALDTVEKIKAYPILLEDRYIPLNALIDIEKTIASPSIYRENRNSVVLLRGKQGKGKDALIGSSVEEANKIVSNFMKKDLSQFGVTATPSLSVKDAQVELNDALEQLAVALGLSLLLIFLTLIIQFGSFTQTLIIMVAIPLGVCGGILSLWLGNSTLSLNSVLGIILLNGIAVNNSIILVEFILNSFKEGVLPKEAAIMAAKQRLRPILITSLTTIFGMLPMAAGLGDGGKILRPLGISVSGGLWFSTMLTIFIVPFLQVLFLQSKQKKALSMLEANEDLSLQSNIKTTQKESESQISDSPVSLLADSKKINKKEPLQ